MQIKNKHKSGKREYNRQWSIWKLQVNTWITTGQQVDVTNVK